MASFGVQFTNATVTVGVTVALIGMSASSARSRQQQVQEPQTIIINTDELDEGKSLSEKLFDVDAAIRCRVESGEVKVVRTAVPPFVDPKYAVDVFTEQIVTILEIIKPSDRLSKEGERLAIAQPVGEGVLDGLRILRDTSFRSFAAGEEYVLLLHWDKARQLFSVSPSDAFLLEDGRVTPSGRASHAAREAGRDEGDFLSRLRRAPTRQKVP